MKRYLSILLAVAATRGAPGQSAPPVAYRIETVAGSSRNGGGGPAQDAQLVAMRNLAVDGSGNLYLSEFEGHRVRRVALEGRISTVAGTGMAGFRGDGEAATQALLNYPAGLAVDRAGSLYIADS